MVERRIRMAKFPHTKSFDTFDFTAQPSLNKALVLELTRGEGVSIHAPVRGRREIGSGHPTLSSFNPRPREGATREIGR